MSSLNPRPKPLDGAPGHSLFFRLNRQLHCPLTVRTAMSIGPSVGEHLVAKIINLSKPTFNTKTLTHQPIKYFLSK